MSRRKFFKPFKSVQIAVLLLALCLGGALTGTAWAQDYNAGVKKYNAKDYAGAFKEWEPLAAQGHAHARFWLGMLYMHGLGVEVNRDLGMHWFLWAARQGLVEAQLEIGQRYRISMEPDYAEAMRWFRAAAAQGNVDAQYFLGLMYAKGEGVPRDDVQAADWYLRAAKAGGYAAQWVIGEWYAQGRGVEQNAAAAWEWTRRAAEQGNSFARKNLSEYAKVHEAAQQGDAQAQYSFAVMYQKLPGLMDYNKSIEWYRKAAENGHADAQYRMYEYFRYSNVNKDWNEAKRFFNLALGQSHEQAMHDACYGHAVAPSRSSQACFALIKKGGEKKQEYVKQLIIKEGDYHFFMENDDAFDWLWEQYPAVADEELTETIERKITSMAMLEKNLDAAEKGDVQAQYEVGRAYAYGSRSRVINGTREYKVAPDDREISLKWLHLAADKGHAEAQFLIGNWYSHGIYGGKNEQEALKWYRLAAANGARSGKFYLESLEKEIEERKEQTPERRMARMWENIGRDIRKIFPAGSGSGGSSSNSGVMVTIDMTCGFIGCPATKTSASDISTGGSISILGSGAFAVHFPNATGKVRVTTSFNNNKTCSADLTVSPGGNYLLNFRTDCSVGYFSSM